MQTLEQIIRPFQSPTTLPKRRLISTNTKIDDQTAEVEWGNAGDLPAPEKREEDFSGIGFEVVKCDDNYNEKERKFNTVRIENPEDPTQYVMVERMNQIAFNKKNEPGNQMQMYNNSTTSFVTLPSLDNTTYWKSNHGDQKCKATYNFTYPAG